MSKINANLQDDDIDWILMDDPEEDSEDFNVDQYNSIDEYLFHDFIEKNGKIICNGCIDVLSTALDINPIWSNAAKSIVDKLDF